MTRASNRLGFTLLALASLGGGAHAADTPVERGRIVLSCGVGPDQKLGQCQVTREEPAEIGLGAVALNWAAGKSVPPAAGPRRAIDLPLCFNITRQPLQAQLDTSAPCDALTRGASYSQADIVTVPDGAVVASTQDVMARMGLPTLTPEVIKANAGKTIGEVMAANTDPRPAVVSLICKVMTSGALDCAARTDPKNPRYEAAALALVPGFKVKVRTIDGLPAPGDLTFPIKLLKP